MLYGRIDEQTSGMEDGMGDEGWGWGWGNGDGDGDGDGGMEMEVGIWEGWEDGRWNVCKDMQL